MCSRANLEVLGKREKTNGQIDVIISILILNDMILVCTAYGYTKCPCGYSSFYVHVKSTVYVRFLTRKTIKEGQTIGAKVSQPEIH